MAEPRNRQQEFKYKRRGGRDDFGRFVITGGPCSNCGKDGPNYAIKYAPKSFELPDGVEIERTILKTTDHYLGLNCGCYAKFHRQVAHIVTARAARAKRS